MMSEIQTEKFEVHLMMLIPVKKFQITGNKSCMRRIHLCFGAITPSSATNQSWVANCLDMHLNVLECKKHAETKIEIVLHSTNCKMIFIKLMTRLKDAVCTEFEEKVSDRCLYLRSFEEKSQVLCKDGVKLLSGYETFPRCTV